MMSSLLPSLMARSSSSSWHKSSTPVAKLLWLVVVLFGTTAVITTTTAQRSDARSLRIVNQAGYRIDAFWINRWQNDELSLSTAEGGILFGTESGLNSYVGHEFEIHELPSKKTGTCGGENGICRKAHFQVNANDDQVITVFPEMRILHEDNKSRSRDQAKKILQGCKAMMEQNETIAALSTMEEKMQALATCMETHVNATLKELQEEIDFQSKLRNQIGSRLGTYACEDVNFTATEPKENLTWTHENKHHHLRIYHTRASSQVVLVENFASPQQCQAVLKQAATQKLQFINGTNGLYGNKGSVKVDPDALAQQQTKRGFFSKSDEEHIHSLVIKMYDFANDQMKIDEANIAPLTVQEELFVLHYEASAPPTPSPTPTESNAEGTAGAATTSTSKHRYDPHCDGPCHGGDYTPGERVATMIIYCDVPNKGGATHFSQSGLHIKPETGSALFFNYLDPITMEVDTGFSEHQGCPVFEGDKRIISHKFRSNIRPKDNGEDDTVEDEEKREL